MAVSVCMATFNGEAYVARQLQSILDQLTPEDEVVIVDDCSTDGTIDVIRRMEDSRIALNVNERNRREVYSFGRAIELAKNDVVFLSDQDDVWLPGRVALMVCALREQDAGLVTGNFEWMDSNERPLAVEFDGVRAADSTRHLKNIADIFIGKTNYFGCAMAFHRGLVPLIIPIPAYVESHDLWIALAANLVKSNVHIDQKILLKRQHGNNATNTISSRTLARKLNARIIFARSLAELYSRQRRFSERPAAPANGTSVPTQHQSSSKRENTGD